MSTPSSVIDRFVDYYAALDARPVSALEGIYDVNATLIDPFGEHRGLPSIERYFTHLLANVESCRFTIEPMLEDAPRFAVEWTMHWSHPRIARGETCILPGCSVLDIHRDRIVRQRDYYDAGEMLYEHLPLLGWAVRRVKGRVRA
ncbi:nuclear transport factor 2 family protein [Enterobacter soli]|uniref:nuclear transport factor 2 family protein n=1 Tax=Enterobacter soli TaxID=885040 RepID=UPI0034D00CBB